MRIRKRRPIGLALALALLACGEAPMQPRAEEIPTEEIPSPGTAVALALVSGDHQEGKAGEALPALFVVRLTDVAGEPVDGLDVQWHVTAGAGVLVDERHESVTSTRTSRGGMARVRLLPTMLGTITVDARAVGLDTLRARFTARTTALVIGNGTWGIVQGPGGSSPNVTVPVGTPIEWVNYYGTLVRIRSKRAPTGGESFDSGMLHEGERFRFVPDVPGLWEWTWEYVEYPDDTAVTTATLRVQ